MIKYHMSEFFKAIIDFFRISKEDRTSLTARAFILGSLIVNAKLLLSGLTIKNISFAVFTGSDYALAFGSLIAGYSMRQAVRNKDINISNRNEEKKE